MSVMSVTSTTHENTVLPNGVQVLRLATLHEEHNHVIHAIRVYVTSIVLNAGQLLWATVTDVQSSQDQDHAARFEAELHVHGRWQKHLNGLRIGTPLMLKCAAIRRSNPDSALSSFILHLDDPPHSFNSAQTVVFFLSKSLRISRIVAYSDLLTAQVSVEPHEPFPSAKTSPQETSGPPSGLLTTQIHGPSKHHENEYHRKRPRIQQLRSVESSPRIAFTNTEHVPVQAYKCIRQIVDDNAALVKTRVDVFGVIVDARAPYLTRGTGLRSELCLVDETSIRGDDSKNLRVYTFEDCAKDALPFRSFGDVVRVRRGVIEVYKDGGGSSNRAQLNLKFFSTVLIWRYDDDSITPCLFRDPISKAGSELKEAVHHLSPYDQKRVIELRKWVRTFIHALYKPPRAYVFTLPEVINRISMMDNLSQSLDIIGQVQHVNEQEKELSLQMVDGLGAANRIEITVCSQLSESDLKRTRVEKFSELYIGWRCRPKLPSWVLLKDVRIDTCGGQTSYKLNFGFFSSTLLFLNESAPLVRSAKEQYSNMCQYISNGNQETTTDHSVAANATEIPKHLQVRAPCKPGDACTNRGEGHRLQEPKLRALNHDVLKVTEIDPSYAHLMPSSIARMIADITSGKEVVHRLYVTVISCTYPRNITNICRPRCRACEMYVRIKSNHNEDLLECDSCNQVFQLRSDSHLSWTYSMRLLAKDESGRAAELWIEGEEGKQFFGGINGTYLAADKVGLKRMQKIIDMFLQPRSVIDCCVIGYRYMDENDMLQVACKVIGTRIASQYLRGSTETLNSAKNLVHTP